MKTKTKPQQQRTKRISKSQISMSKIWRERENGGAHTSRLGQRDWEAQAMSSLAVTMVAFFVWFLCQ